jgi:hypothetical protein
MSKKNKSNQQNIEATFRGSKSFPAPEIVCMDDIGYFSDELLSERMSRLENEKNRVSDAKLDPVLWEVELAYLQREKQIRQTRAEKHEAYMRDFVARGGEVYDSSFESQGSDDVESRILN